MEKVIIVGSAGAGKTTLAKKLGKALKIKVYHLDRLFWTPRDWQRKCKDTRIDILQKVMLEKQWIIEGTYVHSFDLRLNAADTIIFLDMSPLLCLYRVFKRHREDRGHSRRDIPMECTDKFDWSCIWRVLTFPFRDRKLLVQKLQLERTDKSDWYYTWRVLTFPFRDRKLLVQKLLYQAGVKQIIWLRSREAGEAFLANIEAPSEAVSFPSRTCEQPILTGLSFSPAKP